MTYEQLLLNSIKLSIKSIKENLCQGYITKQDHFSLINEIDRIKMDVELLIKLEEKKWTILKNTLR